MMGSAQRTLGMQSADPQTLLREFYFIMIARTFFVVNFEEKCPNVVSMLKSLVITTPHVDSLEYKALFSKAIQIRNSLLQHAIILVPNVFTWYKGVPLVSCECKSFHWSLFVKN